MTRAGDHIVDFTDLEDHFFVRNYCKRSDERDVSVMVGQCYIDDVFD